MTITVHSSNYALKTDETLTQRIQFVYSPLNELFRSLHVLLNPRHHGTNIDWVIEIQDRLTDDFVIFAIMRQRLKKRYKI